MKVYCQTCETDDIPETNGLHREGAIIEGDTTINDHIKLYHPDEFVRIEGRDPQGRMVIRATGEGRVTD